MMYNRHMLTMTVSEARADLARVVDRVQEGGEVTLTRHGKPVAVIIRPDMLRVRRPAAQEAIAAAERLHDWIEEARTTPLSSMCGISSEYAEELVADVYAGREDRPV